MKPWGGFPALHKPSTALHACNPSTERGRKIRSLTSSSAPHYKASLRPCLKYTHAHKQTLRIPKDISVSSAPNRQAMSPASLSLGSPWLSSHTMAGGQKKAVPLLVGSRAPCPTLQGFPPAGAAETMKAMGKILSRRMQMCPTQAGQMEHLLGKESHTGHE